MLSSFPIPMVFADGLDSLRWAALGVSAITFFTYFFISERENFPLRAEIKTASVGGFIVWLALSLPAAYAANAGVTVALMAALVLSAAGDWFLAQRTDKQFLMGLGSFLAGHFGFIIAMALLTDFSAIAPWQFGVAGALWAFALVNIAVFWNRYGSMRVPVILYAHIITLMGAAAVFANLGSGWVLVGAALFILSDATIGLERFGKPYPGSRVFVWSTYIAAEYILLFGILSAVL